MTTYIGTQIIAQWVGGTQIMYWNLAQWVGCLLKCFNHFLYCNPNCNSVSRCVDAKCLYHHLYWNPDHSSVGMCVGDKMSP